jgi:Carboxypeptidase regulatory-like domain
MLCAFVLLPSLLQGQTTGSLSSTVHDQTGAIIPGATVTLTNVDSKAKRSTISNGEGFFSINAIPAATYDVLVSARGFDSLKVSGIQLHPGDNQTISNLTMKIGRVESQVEVSATTAGVTLDSPEKSALITAEDIKRLSTVGRDATELIKFLPGFAASTGGNLNNVSANNGSQTMGFGSSSVSSFSANGATPQTGATTVVSDGNSVMDPGDMGASIANVNMDMVQEIKVQTSNFGADSAKGPVVINAVGKSGGSNYHGTMYLFARNGALNANDWQSNYNQVARPDSKYFFPGGNIGGPVRIPGTDFNHSKKMTFFTGFEYYKQTTFDGLLLSFVPTARMMTGDLTPASIASALNVSPAVLAAQCPNFYTAGTLANSGGVCYSPGFGSSSTYTQQDCQIVAGQIVANPSNGPLCNVGGYLPQDRLSRANIYAKFWPAANRTPLAGNGLASDGYNYQNALTSTHDGYQYHARIDQNFTDYTKLNLTYNFEKINDETPLDNTYYAGNDPIPYPTPAFSNTKSNSLSINFTKVFTPTLTNEPIETWSVMRAPDGAEDATTTTAPFNYPESGITNPAYPALPWATSRQEAHFCASYPTTLATIFPSN